MSSTKRELTKLVFAAVCLSLGLVLPFLTGQIPQIGTALCPMHLPVLLCGFLCGPIHGAVVGFVCPLLRMLLFGMPQFPMSLYMAFELCTYGACAGIMYLVFRKKLPLIYPALAISMIAGRIVYCAVFAAFSGKVADFKAFLLLFGSQFANTWIGIAVQFALVPPIVIALKKAFPMLDGKEKTSASKTGATASGD